jgi:hypothetical protein
METAAENKTDLLGMSQLVSELGLTSYRIRRVATRMNLATVVGHSLVVQRKDVEALRFALKAAGCYDRAPRPHAKMANRASTIPNLEVSSLTTTNPSAPARRTKAGDKGANPHRRLDGRDSAASTAERVVVVES